MALNLHALTEEDRLFIQIAREAHVTLTNAGHVLVIGRSILRSAVESGAPEDLVEHVFESLVERGLLFSPCGGDTYDGLALAIAYEEEVDRAALRKGNALRREILQAAARAFEQRQGRLEYYEDDERSFINRPYAEAAAACRVLQFYGLLEMTEFMGTHFRVAVTTDGYNLVRVPAALAQVLPLSPAEDEAAATAVAPDALAALIRSCEEMLQERGWLGAREELAEGDVQYREGHWLDAVGRYYAATESGLKHRLDEAAVSHGAGASLRDLARHAADADLIPVNYQALFGFLDSIRSPRSHGRGSAPIQIEIGPAEALLAGNHARALLLYVGHRPQA